MTDAIQQLMDMANPNRDAERRDQRRSAIIALTSCMPGQLIETSTPIRQGAVRPEQATEPVEDENKELEIVRAAIELYQRDPSRFRELVLEVTNGEPVNFQLSKPLQLSQSERADKVNLLAGMVNNDLAGGR